MRGVRTIIFAAESRRDLCYASENEGLRFPQNQLFCYCEVLWAARDPQSIHKGAQSAAKGLQETPKGVQRESKVSPRDPNRPSMEAKGRPK